MYPSRELEFAKYENRVTGIYENLTEHLSENLDDYQIELEEGKDVPRMGDIIYDVQYQPDLYLYAHNVKIKVEPNEPLIIVLCALAYTRLNFSKAVKYKYLYLSGGGFMNDGFLDKIIGIPSLLPYGQEGQKKQFLISQSGTLCPLHPPTKKLIDER